MNKKTQTFFGYLPAKSSASPSRKRVRRAQRKAISYLPSVGERPN